MGDENSKSNNKDVTGKGPILVAVDFTADSVAALLWACDIGACVGAPVISLHVVHEPGYHPNYYEKPHEDILRPMRDIAANMMDDFLKEVRNDNPEVTALESMETVIVDGLPPTRIPEVAQLKGARMIVMGSRGRTGLRHLLVGSNAERVVQLSQIPVVIVKAPDRGH